MALTVEQIEFIRDHANTGAKNIALVLGIKYSTVVNVAHRHRISLKTNDKRGRSMAIHVMQTPETTETVCANKPIIDAIKYEMWIKREYMGKKVLWTAEWKKQRQRVLKRDGYICAYCGQDATEVDHIIPRAKGMHSISKTVSIFFGVLFEYRSLMFAFHFQLQNLEIYLKYLKLSSNYLEMMNHSILVLLLSNVA